MLVWGLTAAAALTAGGVAVGRALERKEWQTVIQGKGKAEEASKIRSMIEYRAAIHEAGHTICAWHDPYVRRITLVTIDPTRAGLAGHVNYTASTNPAAAAKWYAISVNMGGIASEFCEFGKARSGGSKRDLEHAREAAKAIVKAGSPVAPWARAEERVEASDNIARMFGSGLDPEIGRILNIGYAYSRDLVEQDRARLMLVTNHLCRSGDLKAKEIKRIFGKRAFWV